MLPQMTCVNADLVCPLISEIEGPLNSGYEIT